MPLDLRPVVDDVVPIDLSEIPQTDEGWFARAQLVLPMGVRRFDAAEAATHEFGDPSIRREDPTVSFYRRRAYASVIARWMIDGRRQVRETGDTELLRRPYIQNVDLVIEAMTEYAARRPTLRSALAWWWKNRL